MEESVTQYLRSEDEGRVLTLGTKHYFFECLAQQVFEVRFWRLKFNFQEFMKTPEVAKLFKSILQVLDNTGNVPVQLENEKGPAYKARLDQYYDRIVGECHIKPSSKFLHVYVFGISTLIGRPIYVLHEDEAGDLSWSYFPVLFSHTYDAVRKSTDYKHKHYVTMFFSTDYCYHIDSSRRNSVEPKSYGCIGLYKKLASASLPREFHDKLQELEKAILDLHGSMRIFVTRCTTTSEELTERRDKVNKSVIGGSAVGIIGGGLTIAGLILTPFTFGASLGLTIAGASLGAAGGIVGGAARAVEGVKQNTRIDEVKKMQSTLVTQENHLTDLLQDISSMISTNLNKHLDNSVDGPGMNLRGFLAIGSAFRSFHGGVAIGLAAARIGASGASIAAAVLGPVSLALDIGFLAEAAHNLNKGSKTGAGEILEFNAKAVEMKMVLFMCMFRGNIPLQTRIVN